MRTARLGAALLLAAAAGCTQGGGGTQRAPPIAPPPTTTLPIDVRPVISAQGLDAAGLRWLIGFSTGEAALVTLPAGILKPVAMEQPRLLAVASDDTAVVDSGSAMSKLDLATGVLTPVVPARAATSRFGTLAPDQYLYLTAQGELASLGPGQAQATTRTIPGGCAPTSVVGVVPFGVPDWLDLTTDSASCLINHRALSQTSALLSISGAQLVGGAAGIFLVARSGAGFDLVHLDPTSGEANTLRSAVALGPSDPLRAIGDGHHYLFSWNGEYAGVANRSILDTSTGEIADVALSARRFEVVGPHGDLGEFYPGSTSALVRYDASTAARLCDGGYSSTVETQNTQFPLHSPFTWGAYCINSGSITVYDWLLGAVRTVASDAKTIYSQGGRSIQWTAADGSDWAVLIGAGDLPVKLCPQTSAHSYASQSADGRVLALYCESGGSGALPMAADLQAGVVRSLFPVGSAGVVLPYQTAVSRRGRAVLVAYESRAGARDPVRCLNGNCTWILDLLTGLSGQGRQGEAGSQGIDGTDDEGVIFGSSLFDLLTPAGPVPPSVFLPGFRRVWSHSADFRYLLAQPDAVEPSGKAVLLDLQAVTGSNLAMYGGTPNGPPLQIGTNGYLMANGVLNLDTGILAPLDIGWQALCPYSPATVSGTLSWLDSKSALHLFTGAGDLHIADRVHSLTVPGLEDCGQPVLVVTDFDGVQGTLARYQPATGQLTRLLPNFSSQGAATKDGLAFGFANPDSRGGDLYLIDPEAAPLSLGARAIFHTEVTASPSRRRVLFRGPQGSSGLQFVIAAVDGSGAKQLGINGALIRFSPDESRAFFDADGALWAEVPQGTATRIDSGVTAFLTDRTGTDMVYSTSKGTFVVQLPLQN